MAESLRIMAFRPLVGDRVIRHALPVTDIRLTDPVPSLPPERPTTRFAHRPHPAWTVAAVGFVALLGAAAFRSVPSVLMDPLHEEFGWSHGTIGAAVSVNMLLYG